MSLARTVAPPTWSLVLGPLRPHVYECDEINSDFLTHGKCLLIC